MQLTFNQMENMDQPGKKTMNIIEYIIVCINAFAEDLGIDIRESYRYLKKYEGINFLVDYYDIEHTLSIENAVEDLKLLCKNNGGEIPEGNKVYDPKIQFQIECVAKNLVAMLMSKYGWNMQMSIDRLYTSETYDRLCDPECGLYYESPVFVFSFLQNEIETGQIS